MQSDHVYELQALQALEAWKLKVQRRPGLFSGISRNLQQRINRIIPEVAHKAITAAFKVATEFLLTGSDWLTAKPLKDASLQAREEQVRKQIERYKYVATAEGALTGAGGILLGLADLPLWLSIKIKMLSHVASLYGYDPGDFRERLYILYVLSLGFSSRKHKRQVYKIIEHWNERLPVLAKDKDQFDWRSFQQEYRDYLDIAKLLQLVPGIGAAVGAVVNNHLTDRLGETAVQAYRMRWFADLNDAAKA